MDAKKDLLATVPNEDAGRAYTVTHTSAEFTFLYPLTGQPCFAVVEVEYVPAARCLETMALKRYLNAYRDEALYFESVTNRLLDDLCAACRPKEMTVTARFTVRGGISTTVVAKAKPSTAEDTGRPRWPQPTLEAFRR